MGFPCYVIAAFGKRRKLSGLVDAPGIHAQPEGGVDQLGIVRRLAECQVDLLDSGVVIMILLGDAGGEIAAAERDCRRLQTARRLCLALGGRLGPLLSIAGGGEREKQRCRQQREMCTSHTAHMLG